MAMAEFSVVPLDKGAKPAAKKPTPQEETRPQTKEKEEEKKEQQQPQAAAQAAGGASLLDEELADLSGEAAAGPLDGLMSDSGLSAAAADGGSILAPVAEKGIWVQLGALLRRDKKKKRTKKENVWDSLASADERSEKGQKSCKEKGQIYYRNRR